MTLAGNIEIENKLEELFRVAKFTEEFSKTNKLSMDTLNALNLSLEECLTNTIKYGYSDNNMHTINVEIWIENNMVRVRITDDGVMFNPFTSPDPKMNIEIEDHVVGGLGIYLVKNFMDSYEYLRNGNKNIILLSKYLV